MKASDTDNLADRLAQVEAREKELSKLQQSLSVRESELNQIQVQVDDKLKMSLLTDDNAKEFQKRLADTATQSGQSNAAKEDCALLPEASAGECFAKVALPAQYKTVTERVLKRQASEKIEVIPAKFETVTEPSSGGRRSSET